MNRHELEGEAECPECGEQAWGDMLPTMSGSFLGVIVCGHCGHFGVHPAIRKAVEVKKEESKKETT